MVEKKALTKREREIICYVADGYKNREIAQKLGISAKTVETHRANIMKKLALRNVAELILYCFRKDLVKLEPEEE